MYVDIKLLGPPSNKTINVLTLDRKDGNIVDGRVDFFIQKGQDANSREVFRDPDGNVLVAEVKNGNEWQSPAMDLRQLINAGFDTLVVRHPDGEFLRWLTPPPNVSQPQQNAPGQQRQQQRQPKIVIELTGLTLHKKNDGKLYDLEVAGKVTQDGQPMPNLSLDFYYDGQYDTQCQLSPGVKTDQNGRFVYTFTDKPAVGKKVSWEVQIRGGASRLFYADIPTAPAEKPKEPAPKPTTLQVILLCSYPVGSKMRHSISLQVVDQKGNPVNGGVCAWVVGPVSAQTGREDLVQRTFIDVDVEGDTEFNSVLMDHNIIQEKPLKLSGPQVDITPKPRLKVSPDQEVIKVYGKYHTITLKTFDKDGVSPEAVDVDFTSDVEVNIYDVATGALIAAKVTSFTLTVGSSGVRYLNLIILGFTAHVNFIHATTKEAISKTLVAA